MQSIKILLVQLVAGLVMLSSCLQQHLQLFATSPEAKGSSARPHSTDHDLQVLENAIKENSNLAELETLLAQYEPYDVLSYFISKGHLDTFSALIAEHYGRQIANETCYCALENKNWPLVKSLIDERDAFIDSETIRDAFHEAAVYSDLPVVASCTKKYSTKKMLQNFFPKDVHKAFYAAASQGHLPVVRYLIEDEAPINLEEYHVNQGSKVVFIHPCSVPGALGVASTKIGDHVFQDAVKNNHAAVAAYLLCIKNYIGGRQNPNWYFKVDSVVQNEALKHAIDKGYQELARLLLQHLAQDMQVLLSNAIRAGTLKKAKFLISTFDAKNMQALLNNVMTEYSSEETKFLIGAQDWEGNTLLIHAVLQGNQGMVKYCMDLIGNDTDLLRITNQEGKSALDYAIDHADQHEYGPQIKQLVFASFQRNLESFDQ